MSDIPSTFIESDDENPRKLTPGGVQIEPITINAGTSTSLLTTSKVKHNTPEKSKEKKDSSQLDKDVYAILRKMDDIGRQISSMSGRQQAIYTLLLELRQELEVLKSSSARFQSTTNTSGIRSIRRNKP